MSLLRLFLLISTIAGASSLVFFLLRGLRVTLRTGVTATPNIHRADRRTKPTEYWLFVVWNILLIVMLVGSIFLGALVAVGILHL